jgi:hypothetical protein
VNSIGALWFGFNGGTLTLKNLPGRLDLTNSNCTIGNPNIAGDTFGQFAYCNAQTFFTAVAAMVAQGKLKVPALGTASDGQPCPTIRSFMVVDQDQSDNVLTTYLVTRRGRLAQNTAANRAQLTGESVEVNGSDNRLVGNFILPAMGCTPWTAPDLADANNMVNALPLNEIQAQYKATAPVALVPANDPMCKVNGVVNLAKLNAFRRGVFQPTVTAVNQAPLAAYCNNINNVGIPRITLNKARFAAAASPTTGVTLLAFLKARLVVAMGAAADGGVGCLDIGIVQKAI